MIAKICIILIVSIALLNTQVRIVSLLFPDMKEKKKVFGYTLLMGFIVASLLLGFSYYVQPKLLSQTLNTNIRYSIFIVVTGAALTFLFAIKKQRRSIFIVSTATILAIITGGVERLLAGSGLSLLFLKAAGEEVLKTSSSQSLTAHSGVFKSDVIIISVLAGLGFALFENIVYFIESGSRGQFLVRSITTSLLHAIFTGTIGYILRKHTTNSYLAYIYSYSVGIGLHILYNVSMTYVPVTGGITFIIGGYFLLSYLLYKSDRLYIQ